MHRGVTAWLAAVSSFFDVHPWESPEHVELLVHLCGLPPQTVTTRYTISHLCEC